MPIGEGASGEESSVVANITLFSGADMSLVTGAGLGKVHV